WPATGAQRPPGRTGSACIGQVRGSGSAGPGWAHGRRRDGRVSRPSAARDPRTAGGDGFTSNAWVDARTRAETDTQRQRARGAVGRCAVRAAGRAARRRSWVWGRGDARAFSRSVVGGERGPGRRRPVDVPSILEADKVRYVKPREGRPPGGPCRSAGVLPR